MKTNLIYMKGIDENEKLLNKVSRKLFLLRRDFFHSIDSLLNLNRLKYQNMFNNKDKPKIKSKKERFSSISISFNSISRENLLHFSVLISILGIFLLFVLSFLISPKFIPLTDLDNTNDGEFIQTTGFISEIKMDRFKICDSLNSDICFTALISQGRIPSYLLEGDYIYIKGIVKSFDNRKFISIQDPKSLELVNISD